jgi:hypothetical protein
VSAPLDPALLRPDAVAQETRALNETMVRLLTPEPEWRVLGPGAARTAHRRGDGPLPGGHGPR